MRVLVTRPQPDAAHLSRRLETLGHSVLVDPLLSVTWLDLPPCAATGAPQAPPQLLPQPYGGVIATSQNALRAIARHPAVLARLRPHTLYAVGPATAALARTHGFADIVEGPGTAAQLAATIEERLPLPAAPLLSLTAETAAFDMVAALQAHGIPTKSWPVYRMTPAQALQPETLRALQACEIAAVILLSAHTARTYATLILVHNQLENIRNIAHLCLSEACTAPLRPLGPLTVRQAARPDIEELLALAGSEVTSLP